jgi:hypothetical protein
MLSLRSRSPGSSSHGARLTPRCSGLATLAAELDIVRHRVNHSGPSAIRGALFFVGAMLALTLSEAVNIFMLDHYEHKWTPAETFWLATLACTFLMSVMAFLFTLPTRRTGVRTSACALLGVVYGVAVFLLGQFLPRILNPEGWPFVIVTWGFLLSAPPVLGFLVSRRGRLAHGP